MGTKHDLGSAVLEAIVMVLFGLALIVSAVMLIGRALRRAICG